MYSVKVLKEDIEKLKFIIEHSSSKSLKNYYTATLLNLCDLLYELTDEEQIVKISRKNIIFMEKYCCNLSDEIRKQIIDKEYMEMINSLTNNSKKILRPINKEYYFDSNISLNDAKDLIKDFICKFDISLYSIVQKALENEHLFLINDKLRSGDGYSLFNPYSKSPYIVIYVSYEQKLNLENLICLVHELGHIIHFHTTINRPRNYNRITIDNFIEFPSTTFETLFINYLIENQIQNKSVQMILNNNLNSLKYYLQQLRIINFIIDQIPNNEEVDVEYLQKLLLSKGINKEEDYIYSCFDKIYLNYEYSLGGLLSFYYLDLFKKDPEKTKKYIYDFMKCIGVMDDNYMLSHFGINKSEFIECKYLKNVVLENQKQLEFYKR